MFSATPILAYDVDRVRPSDIERLKAGGLAFLPVLGDPSKAVMWLTPYPSPRLLFHWNEEKAKEHVTAAR